MWEDDITFCPVKECSRVSCFRHQSNIKDRTIPHSFSVGTPADCPEKAEDQGVYESPINVNAQFDALRITYRDRMEQALMDAAIKVCQKVNIEINEKDLIDALTADRERYKAAYNRGYADGRKEHEKDISVLQDMLSRALEKAGEITRKENET